MVDLILDAMAKAFVSSFGATILNINPSVNTKITLADLSTASGKIAVTFAIPGTPITLSFAWPTLTTTGTGVNTTGSHTIESNGTSNNFFHIGVDVLAAALALAGIDPDPFNFSIKDVINVDLLSPTIGAGLAFTQTFDLNGSLPSATLTDGATTRTLTFGTPTTLYNVGNTFSLNLDPNATLENNTQLTPDLTIGLTALGLSLNHVPGASLGPLLNISTTVPLAHISVFNTTFPVTFASQTIANIKVA